MRHTPSFVALTTRMFSRGLLLILLFSILYCHCYAQVSEKKITTTPNQIKSTMDDSMIISTVMVCSMFTVLIVLVPTVLYYRHRSKEEIDE